MHSLFQNIPNAPPDKILGLNTLFKQDPSPEKVNLGVGAYRTAEGLPYVLPVVRRVEKALTSPDTNHEYLPQEGLSSFTALSARLILGQNSPAIAENRSTTIQSLSGTGALRVAFTFFAKFVSASTLVYVPRPTWSNHHNIVPAAGLPPAREYRYFDPTTRGVDLAGMLADLEQAPSASVVVLHGCAHNPTGADPSKADWEKILDVVKKRSLIPFFDNAYQGFATGDLEEDAWSVQRFVKEGIDVVISQSYAKNMGLYGQRVGALTFISAESTMIPNIQSQLKAIVRAMYSNPPAHGARIAATILGDPDLFQEWKTELKEMAGRIQKMRISLRDALLNNETPGSWDHIVDQIGMFSFTGLTTQQVQFMREKYHIYMTDNGRISMAGLTDRTVQFVADAMKDAVLSVVKQD